MYKQIRKTASQTATPCTAGYRLGPYTHSFSENPSNDSTTIKTLDNSEEFPASVTGNFAYLYRPATKTIKLDHGGTDEQDIAYSELLM